MSRVVGEQSGLKARLFSRERVERSERGDTMIEILLALIVLGLTSVALIVAFSTTLSASAEHRTLTSADIAINNYSQQVIAGIEANQNLFTCPTPALTLSGLISELAIPSNPPYSPTITNVQYWNSSTSSFSSSCIANTSELITVSVGSGSSNQTISFVVDSPSAGSNYVGGAPTGLSFIAPTNTTSAISGASLPVNPVVEVFFGNSPDATDLSPINLTLGDANGNPTSTGTLSGCSSNDLNGIVTYSGCTISLTISSAQPVDFTLVATDGSLTATSPIIAVSGSTSSYLSFTTQPSAGYSGSLMTTQPVIKAYQGGTTTVDTTVMSITLTTSGSINGSYQLTSCGGTSGYSTTTESNGVVTVTDSSGHGGTFAVSGCDFSGQFYYDVNSGAVGTPYTMTASSPNVTSATSQPFAATGYGAAAQMQFIVEPTGGIAASTSATTVTMNAFEVQIEDSWGNLLSGQGQAPYAGSISVMVTGGATLTCTPSSSEGVFTFSGCSAPLGSNLTLTATATGTGSAGVTPEVSSSFNNAGPVASLVWYPNYPSAGSSPQPVAGASGSVMTNQPVLAYEDAGTNPGESGPEVVTADTASVSYTSSYSSGTESAVSPNGILTTCSNLPPIDGIISAGNCTFVGLVGTNYTMSATTTSGPTISSPASSTFSPTGPGPASQLVFTPSPGVEPVAAAAGSPFTTEPVVVVEDVGGNIVASASTQVEMNSYLYNVASPTNPTVQAGAIFNCSTLAPVNGATSLVPVSGYLDVEGSCAFGGLVGTSYQLVATAPGLTQAVSTTFTPTTFGPASVIAVSGCSPSVKWANTCVLAAAVQDAWGNTVTSFNSGVTFADVGGAGTVSGLGTSTAVSGVANDTVTGTVVGPELVTATEGSVISPQYSFNIIGDTTTATVAETPTSVTYGAEQTSVFTVTVVTGNHEVLPSTDPVIVNVGSASCTANVAPSGTGGSGSCSIGATALPFSSSPYAVTATYPGDAELQASAPATATTGLTVNRDSTTSSVSESPTSVVYGHEQTPVFTVTVVTGNHEVLPSTDPVTVNVGSTSCTANVTPSGTGGSGTCSIGATALPYSASTYSVTATFGTDADLSSSVATPGPGFTVNKDTTTSSVTESPTSVTYGNEQASVFTVTVVTGNHEVLPSTDPVTVNVGSASCVANVAPSGTGGSGTCSIGATALPYSASTYSVTATFGTDADLLSSVATPGPGFTVNKAALTITASSPTVTYGASVPTITAGYAGFVNGETSANLTTQPTCTTTYTTASAAGSSPSTSCSGAVDANYSISYVAGHVTVNQAPLTITASSPTVTYGASVPTITAGYAGFVNGQTSANLTTQPTCTTTYTTSSAAGSSPSTSCSGAVDANYSISYVAGSVTVNKATVTATPVTVANKTYSGTTAGTVTACTLSPLGVNVTCNFAGATATFTSANVGVGITVNVTGLALSGTGAGNYVLSSTSATTTANITQAPLTITASSPTVTYGASVPTITAGYAGFVNGETSANLTTQPTCTTTYTTASAAGTTPSTSCSGAVDANYSISYVAGHVTVNKATVTATPVTVANKTYSGTTAGTVTACTLSPLGVNVTCNFAGATATFTSANVGVGITVNVTGLALSGTGAGNYVLSSTSATTTANITQAPLTITASSPTVTYGASVPTITAGYAGFVNGETSANLTTQPTCTTTYTTASAAGSSPSTSCSGAVDANYSISYVAGHVTVNKATPTVSITNTTNPTGIGAGNLVLTATVTGVAGDAAPTGTLTWTISGAVSTCNSTTALAGSGPSTATCTITTPGAGTYMATGAYGGDTNYNNLTTPSTFGMYIGDSPNSPDVPPGPEYYTINSATSVGSATNTANTITPGTAETLTSISMTFNGGSPSSAAQTVTVGKITTGTYSATAMTCTVPANIGETCSFNGSVSIPSGSSINIGAIGNNLHTDFWFVTFTNP